MQIDFTSLRGASVPVEIIGDHRRLYTVACFVFKEIYCVPSRTRIRLAQHLENQEWDIPRIYDQLGTNK